MQIGMSLTTSYARNRDPKELMDGLVEQVETMAELGFASLSLGDHHVTRDNYFQVIPTMSRMSAHSGDMQLIPLFLLPFYNPILLAEQLGTLDVVSGGRTTLIAGLGHQPEAHIAFQTPERLRVSRFTETFEIMRQLWSEDNVSYQGKHYSFEGVSINPKPVSQHLPMWIGSGADPAIRRTARLADAWVISPSWHPELIEEKLQFYREALDEFGRTDQINDVVLRRDAHLAATNDIARGEAKNLFEEGYRGFSPQELQESLIVGGPDECISYLKNMESLGVTHVLFRCAIDDREKALQTIQLLGKEVIPHLG